MFRIARSTNDSDANRTAFVESLLLLMMAMMS
jgi:hypothetical protein